MGRDPSKVCGLSLRILLSYLSILFYFQPKKRDALSTSAAPRKKKLQSKRHDENADNEGTKTKKHGAKKCRDDENADGAPEGNKTKKQGKQRRDDENEIGNTVRDRASNKQPKDEIERTF